MTTHNESIQNKTVVLDKINILLKQIEEKRDDIALEIEKEKLETTYKVQRENAKQNNFDVVSISRPIYWPDKGYYENISKDNYFKTCYNSILKEL